MARLLDYAEHQAREVLRAIPDGDIFFADYADEDGLNGNPCRLALTLRIEGERRCSISPAATRSSPPR